MSQWKEQLLCHNVMRQWKKNLFMSQRNELAENYVTVECRKIIMSHGSEAAGKTFMSQLNELAKKPTMSQCDKSAEKLLCHIVMSQQKNYYVTV